MPLEKQYYAQAWTRRDVGQVVILAVILIANVLYFSISKNKMYGPISQAVAAAAALLLIQRVMVRESFKRRPYVTLSESGFRFMACNIKWDAIQMAQIYDDGRSRWVALKTLNDERLIAVVPPTLQRLFRENQKRSGYAVLLPPLVGVTPEALVAEIAQAKA